jgi:hypothetical protein
LLLTFEPFFFPGSTILQFRCRSGIFFFEGLYNSFVTYV